MHRLLRSSLNEKLAGLAYGFEQWFSHSKWNRHDDARTRMRRMRIAFATY